MAASSGCEPPTRTASDENRTPSERRPFVRSVFPLETRSMIASASPSRGATSTEPVTSTSVAATPWLARSSRARRGKTVAMRSPARSSSVAALRLLRHRRLERAPAESQPEQLGHVALALPNEIRSRDPTVDDAVLDVLGDIGRPDEEHLDRCVPAREREGSLSRHLRPEPRLVQERDGRLAKAPLRRDRDLQSLVAAVGSRSSASR